MPPRVVERRAVARVFAKHVLIALEHRHVLKARDRIAVPSEAYDLVDEPLHPSHHHAVRLAQATLSLLGEKHHALAPVTLRDPSPDHPLFLERLEHPTDH